MSLDQLYVRLTSIEAVMRTELISYVQTSGSDVAFIPKSSFAAVVDALKSHYGASELLRLKGVEGVEELYVVLPKMDTFAVSGGNQIEIRSGSGTKILGSSSLPFVQPKGTIAV